MKYDRIDGPLYRQPLNRRSRNLTIPARVGPHTRLVFAEMRRQGRTYDEVQESSGVLRATMKAWRRKNKPGLESLEAVLNSLGWNFTPTPSLEVLSPDLAGELDAVATKLATGLPEVWAALIDIGMQQRNKRARDSAGAG
ncbi:hypothetical protein ONR75_10340 [Rhodopseudomonas sp. P2A-2r]|uniref:hypothetical protein n=1 Tax=Rhodopseudomonas sp. P2A-2r TaxID=2991972 RepID=UPI002234632D|nr:hypothetical protein [Rhodopseudomonas sp. P2A-2r]UZE50978.1 hypothetical protein ONR75_10340 [Rhodopseudomonas sp. P2A-2r]